MTASTDVVQAHASIGVPGEWIADDATLDPTISKIGGKAQYFSNCARPKTTTMHCRACHRSLYFLCQMNAPLLDEQRQRNLYVFMCGDAKCTQRSQGWKVVVQKGPAISDTQMTQSQSHDAEVADDACVQHGHHEAHDLLKMIKSNNKRTLSKQQKMFTPGVDTASSIVTSKQSQNTLDAFACAKKPSSDSSPSTNNGQDAMQHKLNGLNDDFARLMAMQQQLLSEVDRQQNTRHLQQKTLKKEQKKKLQQQKLQLQSQKQIQTQKQQKQVQKMENAQHVFAPFEIAFMGDSFSVAKLSALKKQQKETKKKKTVILNDKEIDIGPYLHASDLDKEHGDDEDEAAEIDVQQGIANGDLMSDYLQRLSLHRNQCIRYCFAEVPMAPLVLDLQVPDCKYCGQRKVLECQIMSPILHYLRPKQIHHEWLTALIYVCPASCREIDDDSTVCVCCE